MKTDKIIDMATGLAIVDEKEGVDDHGGWLLILGALLEKPNLGRQP
jgi:hypothetical protein